MQLANPQYLWLFLIFIPLIVRYIYTARNARPTLGISSAAAFATRRMPWRASARHVMFVLRLGAIGCLIMILARPQSKDNWQTTSTEGTDIVIAMDVSSSMKAKDLNPDRLESAKNLSKKFIDGRPDDNIGIVIFAGEALTGLPLTIDHNAIDRYIDGIDLGMVEDGTAIGDGIATAINRLANGHAKSKSIILLTDGTNNTGIVTPKDAAQIAKDKGIKIYTVAIGKYGKAMAPAYLDAAGNIQYEMQDVVIDENTLKSIAKTTDGQYFRATDNKVLADVFHQIDQLEKTKMDVSRFSHTEDDYAFWGWLLLGLLLLELTLRYTLFRTAP